MTQDEAKKKNELPDGITIGGITPFVPEPEEDEDAESE